MKKLSQKLFPNLGLSMLILWVVLGCNDDINTIGTNIVDHQNFSIENISVPVTAYSNALNPVQTNGLSSTLLGIYQDPIYGNTTAEIVTQIVPTTFNPDFGKNPKIDTIILSVPYYSKAISRNSEGNTIYEIDSLYGNAPIKLEIYQNNYFLRELDPQTNLQSNQIYYSNANQTINFDNHKGKLLFSQEKFLPDPSEIVIVEAEKEGDMTEKRLPPMLNIPLKNTDSIWNKILFDMEDSDVLSNRNNFVEFFRGLYFKVSTPNNSGHMVALNFASSEAKIIVKYTKDSETEGNTREEAEYSFNFSGVRLNTFQSNYNFTTGDSINGDLNLFLKGGQGSMGIIELFNGFIEDEDGIQQPALEYLRSKKDEWLVNEAQLVFYENEPLIINPEAHKFDRLYLYDLENNRALIDYSFDPNTNQVEPLNTKVFFSTRRSEDDNGNVKFRFRITEHIKNVLYNDSTNVQLGLVISANLNNVQNAKVLDSSGALVKTYPESAVLSPKGTVLYGSSNDTPENLRARLELFYTKPK